MSKKISIHNRLTRAMALSVSLIVFVSLASAAIGIDGEGNKAKRKNVLGDFKPIKTTNGFTLKAGPVYKGSLIFKQQKSVNTISFNSLVTYQKGNTTYIIPHKYKFSTNNSSLQLVNFKVRLHK
jgi:uncharacterized lipoprotein YehR (DUF1307 family)